MALVNRQEAEDLLRSAKNILIAPSSPMDGDSVGSSLALMAVLRKMGKQVTVVAYDPMPEYLKFLPFAASTLLGMPIYNLFNGNPYILFLSVPLLILQDQNPLALE